MPCVRVQVPNKDGCSQMITSTGDKTCPGRAKRKVGDEVARVTIGLSQWLEKAKASLARCHEA